VETKRTGQQENPEQCKKLLELNLKFFEKISVNTFVGRMDYE